MTISTPFDSITSAGAFVFTGAASTLAGGEIIGPSTTTITPGGAGGDYTALIEEPGVTEVVGQGPGILAQIGYGTQGQSPITWPDFFWSGATWDSDAGAADVFAGSVAPTTFGTYGVAFRFSNDGGYQWLYVDGDSSTTFDPNELSFVNVVP